MMSFKQLQLIVLFSLIPTLSLAIEIDTNTLAGDSTDTMTAPPPTPAASAPVSMLGLQPDMTLTEVKNLGVTLTPYINYVTPTEYGTHAFYGMQSYLAQHLPQSIDDSALVILSFNNQQRLKLVQVESKVQADQPDLSAINQRIAELARQFAQLYGPAKIDYQRDAVIDNHYLPIYQMKTPALWVSITPVIKERKSDAINVVYVIKYFVQV